MEHKIVFFDIDGTLTSEIDGKIMKSAKEAIKTLLNKGTKVVIATGRPLSMCTELIELGVETFIAANGACIKHKEKIIHSEELNKKYVDKFSQFAFKNNHAVGYYTQEYIMNGIQNKEVQKALKETLSLDVYPKINEKIVEEDVYGICLYAGETEVEKFKKEFPNLTFKRWHPFVLDVFEKEVSKSVAIKKVLSFFGIDAKHAVAFGDGGNDVDMIETVGLGIAMGNAGDKLKEKAKFVTKNSSEDGIEFALKKFNLI